MDSWTEQVKRILDRAPTRALPLSRLLQLLREEGVAVSGREEWILRRITEQPEAFKVIPDRLGPWVVWAGEGDPGSPWYPSRRFGRDPWVMTCSPVTSSLGIEGKVVGRIQESLQAWGRELDDGSPVAVARWIGANQKAARTFGEFFRGEGAPPRIDRSTNHPPRRSRGKRSPGRKPPPGSPGTPRGGSRS